MSADPARPDAGPPVPAGRILDKAVYDARREAEDIVAAARAQAEALRGAAEGESRAAREAARAEGLRAGRAEAAAVVCAAQAAAVAAREAAREDIARLGVLVARRILGREVALSRGAVSDLVAAALAAAAARGELQVRVHPDAIATLEADRPRLMTVARQARAISFVPDATLAPGDCVIETPAGWFDGRLEVQLAAFEAALLEGAR